MRKLGFLALAGALLAGEAIAFEDSKAAMAARAKANLTSLFSDQDYPAAALAAREQAPSASPSTSGLTAGSPPARSRIRAVRPRWTTRPAV